MTAEIIIMNTGAVALAADSAVTASRGGHDSKIFSQQNKIFALTELAPVGILVYGLADFMSIPWETVIKEYRRKHGRTTYARLQDYMEAFLRFLKEDMGRYIPNEQQEASLLDGVRGIFEEIQGTILDRLRQVFPQLIDVEDADIEELMEAARSRLTADTIDEYHQRARQAPFVDDANEEIIKRGRDRVRPRLRAMREEIFGAEEGSAHSRRLNSIAYRSVGVMTEDITPNGAESLSGIVIAGFGEDELMPAYSSVEIEGLYEGMLKSRQTHEARITPDLQAAIVPFAQIDMMHTFMEGIDPEYVHFLFHLMERNVDEYTTRLLEELDKYSPEERGELAIKLGTVQTQVAETFVKRVTDFGATHANEIVSVVSVLPKEQLADMAEALISLTSLRRRVSFNEESVGGPIDVAVITKGDGLVWIKRKHYFPAELNPAYFERTYGKGRLNDQDKA